MPEIVPAWPDYFLSLAQHAAVRSKCTRRQVGAVIADPVTHDVIATGYNGSPAGWPECGEACPRGQHYRTMQPGCGPADAGPMPLFGKMCACGNDWPCPDAVEPGSSYDTGNGACIYTHAEGNCLLRAGSRSRGCILYVSEVPCDGCRKLAAAAGIALVQWPGGWWDVKPSG